MCTEWKSAVYEDALGSPGIEDLLVLIWYHGLKEKMNAQIMLITNWHG